VASFSPAITFPASAADLRVPVGSGFTSNFKTPAFYNSREVKELGLEAVKIQGSRMMGVLLAPNGVFLVYNGSPTDSKWDYRYEQRAQGLMQIVLCQERLPFLYAGKRVSGLLLEDGMEPFSRLLESADKGARCFLLLDGNYDHFYYLTKDSRGETLLKLLCDPAKTAALDRTLSQGLFPRKPGLPVEHDALDADGNPVLFGYLLDIPRINRFLTALRIQERMGTLICFDFQTEALLPHCDGLAKLQAISFEKFERRFFP